MTSVSLQGLPQVIEAIRSIPTSIGRETVFSQAADEFATVLSERTRPGWNRRLGKSVLSQPTGEGYAVGYEVGVETAGNGSLDGRRRRSRWVSVNELETVLQETADEFLGAFSGSVLAQFAEGVDSVLS